jgi:hypothetical protein
MTLEEKKDYLDALPGVLALWWFMENVSDEDPDRQALFFHCRERVRRYQGDGHHSSKPWVEELQFDKWAFEQIAKEIKP